MARKLRNGIAGTKSNAGNLTFNNNTISPFLTDTNIVLDVFGTGKVTTSDRILATNNTSSSSSVTGAVRVTGGVGINNNLWATGTVNVGGTGINSTIGATTPSSARITDLTASGLVTLSEQTYAHGIAKTGATGVVVHDFTEGASWYHTNMVGNFTANFTNFPTTDNRVITIQLYLIQGNTPYYANAVQVNGVAQTLRWAGYTVPNVLAGKFDIQTLRFVRVGGSFTVFSSLASHSVPPDGTTQANAAPSAAFIKTQYPASANGVYWLDHGTGAYQVYCLMDNGGHILVGKIASSTSAASPWMYNGANWSASSPSNEANNQNLTSLDGVGRGWYSYTINSNLRMCLGTTANALTLNVSNTNCRAYFTGTAVDLTGTFSRAQFLTWFATGTGQAQTVFDNQPFCNRSGVNRTDSASTAMRFGITMNNENDCSSNDSSVGFGTYTNGQTTGPRAIPAGGHRWSPDIQYPAIGFIFAQ